MANYRRGRINERIREELCTILTRVKDPRVSGAFISITVADCTPELKYAKIYFSVIGGEKEQREAKAGLDSAAGFIRGQLAHALDLRQTPELKFIPDDSIKNGAHINELLKQVDAGADEDDYE